jgi:hypothetical protein
VVQGKQFDWKKERLMRSVFLAAGLAISTVIGAAAMDDTRVVLDLPREVRTVFLEHMRSHMNSLDNVLQLMAAGKTKEAATFTRKEMAIGQGLGIGRYMPAEFREMGFGFHRAADDFARLAAETPEPPDAAGWSKLINGLAQVTAQCNGCHAAFRVK